jgi:hypothetical protein
LNSLSSSLKDYGSFCFLARSLSRVSNSAGNQRRPALAALILQRTAFSGRKSMPVKVKGAVLGNWYSFIVISNFPGRFRGVVAAQ